MTNRLANEASPYLQQHANNPVDWFPWGDEALARARREDKPILLSVGYSACHWCHVMERECFEDDAIAKQMNDGFVCIKVDREERPDLDQIYQLVVQLLGRSGGWPLTVFLTPEQQPFFGGTYFPPRDRHGMPGFPKVLTAVADAYKEKRGEVTQQAAELTDAITRVADLEPAAKDAPLGPEILARASATLERRFDDQNGGFGGRPKFPNTMALDILLRRGALDGDAGALGRALLALDAMRSGGVYDQLGGGFHRYSTDEKWLVPHFEKMLYDNALLLRLYVDAWRVSGEERFATTARAVAAYVAREMTSPDGGFYATQDADSEGEEGKFFVWSRSEVTSALDADEAKVACAVFGITPQGNFEESGATVLSIAKDTGKAAIELHMAPSKVEELLARAKAKMFELREKRIKPFRDEKIMASWNGLMIASLADAGAALEAPELLDMARRAFAHVEATLVKSGRVLRHVKDGVAKGPGFLDDHGFVARAALELYEATAEVRYAEIARGIGDAMIAHFWDDSDATFFFVPDDGERLIHRAKDPYDHAQPSGASVALEVLARLGATTDERYAQIAERGAARLSAAARDNPFGMAQTVLLVDRLVRGAVDVVIAGTGEKARGLAREAFRAYLPNRNFAWPDGAPLLTKDKAGTDVAYVCRGRTCSLPVDAPDALRDLLKQ
jgi:uncharacterized protein YyaL (SSP411 family)